MEDHIVEEIRQIREEHAAQFNYDLDAIFADYKRLEAESKRKLVSFGPHRIQRLVPVDVSVPVAPSK